VAAERRPPFAQEFPRDPALDALVDAFARGDYERVRSGALELVRSSGDEAIAHAARTLLDRTRPDPTAVALLLMAALLLLVVAAWWMTHGRPPG